MKNSQKLWIKRPLFLTKFYLDTSELDAKTFRKGGRPLVGWFLRIFRALGGELNGNWVRVVVLALRGFALIQRRQGLVGLVKYLKTANVVLQQSLGGHRERDLTSLGPRISRCGDGLPRLIPVTHRIQIRKGVHIYIRMWLSLFALYRVLEIPCKLKIKTITGPFTGHLQEIHRLKSYFSLFTRLFCFESDRDLKKWPRPDPFPIWTASPNTYKIARTGFVSTHPTSILASRLALLRFPAVQDSLMKVVNFLPWSQEFQNFWNYSYDFVLKDNKLAKVKWPEEWGMQRRILQIGKLGLKKEAAGKLRVFAMVDCWSQWALNPLHKVLFKILERHPMDGTKNQLRPLEMVPFLTRPIFSFDLSAATDRLPLSIQKGLLGELVRNNEFASAWASLLVDRSYNGRDPITKRALSVRYAVGQPMGALSSWAMLAYTHHFIVQVAAWDAGFPKTALFKEYAVLGDDICIWHPKVAFHYQRIVTRIGVEIGLAKSVISLFGSALEFAKRTLYKGTDVSPISLKELAAAMEKSAAFLTFIRKYKISYISSLRILGYGYRSSPHSRGWRLLDLLLRVPSGMADLAGLFKVSLTWVDQLAPAIDSYGNQGVKALTALLRLLREEAVKSLNRASNLWSETTQTITRMQLEDQRRHKMFLGLYRTPDPGIDEEVHRLLSMFASDFHVRRARESIKDLESAKGSMRMVIEKIDKALVYMDETAFLFRDTIPMPELPGLSDYLANRKWPFRPISGRREVSWLPYVESWGNLVFKTQDLLGNQWINQVSQRHRASENSAKAESRRNERMWNRWLSILAEFDKLPGLQNERGRSRLSGPLFLPSMNSVLAFFRTLSLSRLSRSSPPVSWIARSLQRNTRMPNMSGIFFRRWGNFMSFLTLLVGETLVTLLGYSVLFLMISAFLFLKEWGGGWSAGLLAFALETAGGWGWWAADVNTSAGFIVLALSFFNKWGLLMQTWGLTLANAWVLTSFVHHFENLRYVVESCYGTMNFGLLEQGRFALASYWLFLWQMGLAEFLDLDNLFPWLDTLLTGDEWAWYQADHYLLFNGAASGHIQWLWDCQLWLYESLFWDELVVGKTDRMIYEWIGDLPLQAGLEVDNWDFEGDELFVDPDSDSDDSTIHAGQMASGQPLREFANLEEMRDPANWREASVEDLVKVPNTWSNWCSYTSVHRVLVADAIILSSVVLAVRLSLLIINS